MTQAVSRLALLMKILKVAGYDMALALDIDPSLISKWKRNRRRVPGRTDTMQKIASFLLNADEKLGNSSIQPLLEKIAGGIPISREQSVELLTQWLLDPEPPDWYTNSDITSQIRLNQNSYTCKVDVFQGAAGRHSAVFEFFDKIQSMPPETQLFILIQARSEWIDNFPEFILELKNQLNIWLTAGHRMEIIHWVDQHPDNLQPMIQNWLPLHLEAQFTSLYVPHYGQRTLPMALFMIPDQLALVGLQSNLEPLEYHTVVYRDQATIHQFEWVYQNIRKDCQLLVENFRLNMLHDLVSRHSDDWHQNRNKIVNIQSKLPLLFGMSMETLQLIIDDNAISMDRAEELLSQWSGFYRAKEAGHRIRLIHHLGAIEKTVSQKEYIDPYLSALVGQPIKVRQEILRETLIGLGHEILDNPSLEIALVRSDTYNRSVWPNLLVMTGSFLNAWDSKIFHNILFSQEATLVHAFENYYIDRWHLIPNVSRDRQVLSALLIELAGSPIENQQV